MRYYCIVSRYKEYEIDNPFLGRLAYDTYFKTAFRSTVTFCTLSRFITPIYHMKTNFLFCQYFRPITSIRRNEEIIGL